MESNFGLFFIFSSCQFSGIGSRIPELLKCRKFNFNLRRLLYLGNASSEQNLRLKNLDYFSFISSIIYLLFGCPMPNFGYYGDYSLNNPVLITVFGLSVFDPKVSGSHTTLSAQWGLRREPSYLI